MNTRRNLLVMLGLTPAVAIGAETITKVSIEPELKAGAPSYVDRASMSDAFRNLADMIDRGDLEVVAFETNSSIKPNSIMEHIVTAHLIFKA